MIRKINFKRFFEQFYSAKSHKWSPHLGDLYKDTLGLYYLNVESYLNNGHFNLFDDRGIPIRGSIVAPKYTITTVCAFALANWNDFLLLGNESSLEKFLQTADWLQEIQADCGAFFYHYPIGFGIKPPWCSGMAQGEALSVFARAYQKSGNSKFLLAGQKALNSMLSPIEQGGTMGIIDGKFHFIEEAPSAPQSHVLNGFLYACFGLFDWRKIEPMAGTLFWESWQKDILNLLDYFDLGYWSRYDLHPSRLGIADLKYHMLHIAQLSVLGYVFPESKDQIARVMNKWKMVENSIISRGLVINQLFINWIYLRLYAEKL